MLAGAGSDRNNCIDRPGAAGDEEWDGRHRLGAGQLGQGHLEVAAGLGLGEAEGGVAERAVGHHEAGEELVQEPLGEYTPLVVQLEFFHE